MDRLKHLGVEEGRVKLASSDSDWPLLYKEESQRIKKVCNNLILEIAHIGSTAIPGIEAKPIIDIMIGCPDFSDAEKCVPLLESLDYIFKGEYGIPGRLFFVGMEKNFSCFHLHVVARESDFWYTHLLFRDYLLAHPETAHQYEELKRGLSVKFQDNRDAYTDGKNDFIQSVIKSAREWQA